MSTKPEAAKVVPFPRRAARQWDAAKVNPLTVDWPTYNRPADLDIRYGLGTIRARCRELAQNSDHAKGILRIARNNIVGETGFLLQSRARRANGAPDKQMRARVEDEWAEWGKRGNCEVSGKFSWRELQRHVVEGLWRDGEAFVRILRRWPYNRWGFALQVIDPEVVDTDYNGEYQGREVRMGVELDEFRRPVAYHLYGEPPLTTGAYRWGGKRERVPAGEMLHIYRAEFCWQTRGVPWYAVASGRMHMLQATEDAEVTASRASAAKFTSYEAQEWAPPPVLPTETGQIVDASGNPVSSGDPGQFQQDVAPGSMEVVPYGYRLIDHDPQHPNANMPDFLKWGLRSIGTGTGVNYHTLGNDADGVNYTSLRFFLGIERDNWREQQDWFKDEFPDPVRQAWTEEQIDLRNLVPRPGRDAELHRVHWQARRWEGPDPAKQASADKQDLEIGATTLTEIHARKGRDLDDVIMERVDELKRIREAAHAADLPFELLVPYLTAKANAAAPPTPPESDDD